MTGPNITEMDGWTAVWQLDGPTVCVDSITDPDGRAMPVAAGSTLGQVLDQMPRKLWTRLRVEAGTVL
ncbi:hypothetical protein [Nocardia wallacei]|uniref:hypothetical protein n=1 Tax=Nocardia wallacei TaxID=480035 RepID=UPI0024578181|nr:hypothetical protein [Nocardia wallacei]